MLRIRHLFAAFGCSISRTLWVLVCGEQFIHLKESNRFRPASQVVRARNMRLFCVRPVLEGNNIGR